MIRMFLSWWADRMLEMLPASLRRAGVRPDACILAVAGADDTEPAAVRLTLRRRGSEVPLGEFPLDQHGLGAARAVLRRHRQPLAITVPAGALLERHLVLPLAAEGDAGSLLRYEMDRVTPFGPDDLFWNWSVTRRDRQRRRLHVCLMLVPKMALRGPQTILDALGAAPAWLEAVQADGTPRAIPLGQMANLTSRHRRRLRLMLAATGGLVVLAALLPFALQSAARSRVEEKIHSMEPQVRLASSLRQRLAADASGMALLATEQRRVGDPLSVLDAVTTALPDDTYLTDLVLRNRRLEITGRSRSAARLIAALAATPSIRDPAFISSVTRTEDGSDVFSIRAEAGP